MKTKKVFFSELAYILGIVALAFGTAWMELADFGMSMVVAPAYLIHLKLSQFFSWYSFGVSEYIFQAVLLIIISLIMRHFKKGYLFSFVTAVIYGFTLDFAISVVDIYSTTKIAGKVSAYLIGMLFCAMGVSLLFRTYLSPEAYELLVKELSVKYRIPISRVKTIYDCCSCTIGILLSFTFFGIGHFEGVKLGTIVCALVNGWLIGRFNQIFDHFFEFKDGLKLRHFFLQ